MVYRIDFQNYLLYAIDYFTRDELVNVQYAIISAKVTEGHRLTNCNRVNELYPEMDAVEAYVDTGDKEVFEKMYMEMAKSSRLHGDQKFAEYFAEALYKTFINPMLRHYDVWIICDRRENIYVDALCKCLLEYKIEVINLNELFEKGSVGPYHIDRKAINDEAVTIRRLATRDEREAMACTKDGRYQLIKIMNLQEKLTVLKSVGVKVKKSDLKNIDQILIDSWASQI